MNFSSLSNATGDVVSVLLLIAIAIVGRYVLVLAGQTWVRTFAHTATLTVLPIITYVITNVISGNIALSLGMVGALSIVRFRNPVKSPFELAIYFAAITMGIAAAVSLKWLLFLFGALGLALAALSIASYVARTFFGQTYFQTSFTEGNRLSTLEIDSNSRLAALEGNVRLIAERKQDNVVSYVLASSSFEELQQTLRLVEGENEIVSSRLNK